MKVFVIMLTLFPKLVLADYAEDVKERFEAGYSLDNLELDLMYDFDNENYNKCINEAISSGDLKEITARRIGADGNLEYVFINIPNCEPPRRDES